MLKRLLIVCALTAVLATLRGLSQASNGELVVIVNSSNAAHRVSKSELRPIFQTTQTRWSDGRKVACYNLPETHPARQQFDRWVLGMTPDEVTKYWIDRRIRGGARPPRKLRTNAAVVRAVASDSDAIGYVPASSNTKGTKIIARIRKGRVVPP